MVTLGNARKMFTPLKIADVRDAYSTLVAAIRQAPRKAFDAIRGQVIFDRLVLLMIIINYCVLIWSLVDHDHEELLKTLDFIILLFFMGEVGLRIRAAGRAFLLDRWLIFDALIVLLALVPLGASLFALRVTRAARLAHMSRHLPHVHHAFGLRALSWLGRRIKGRLTAP